MECEGGGEAAPQSAALTPAPGPGGAQAGLTCVRARGIEHAQMECPLEELLVTLAHPHPVMHVDFWNLKIADTTGWPKCPFEMLEGIVRVRDIFFIVTRLSPKVEQLGIVFTQP